MNEAKKKEKWTKENAVKLKPIEAEQNMMIEVFTCISIYFTFLVVLHE